jgi:hypothetical protein
MKSKILIYIISCFVLSVVLGNIIYKLINGSFDRDNILFFVISIYTQFLLSTINILILFVNSKNLRNHINNV